jgi:indole-3-glycerol phosphate synthase
MILDDIVKSTKIRVERAKERLPLNKEISKEVMFTKEAKLSNNILLFEETNLSNKNMPSKDNKFSYDNSLTKQTQVEPIGNRLSFEEALKINNINFICEVKKASPSKGIIANDFPYIKIAKEYEAAGASCISVITEPDYFLGSDKYLSEIRDNVNIPILRKDFIIDEYQIYESKLLGADCILLICSILTREQLLYYLELCDELQLSVLVEAHDEEEVKLAVSVGARMIGVNNRNLNDFSVNMTNSLALRELVPNNILFISESGIKTPEEILLCKRANVNGVLIGETLMKAKDKKKILENLKSLLD